MTPSTTQNTTTTQSTGVTSTGWFSRLGHGSSAAWRDFAWANHRISEMRADLDRDNAF
jgi:hypothetical protein